MRHPRTGPTMLISGALALGVFGCCGPQIQTDDGKVVVSGESTSTSTSMGDASQTATSVGSGSSHEPIDCPEGEVQCGDECADLRSSNDHCGSCDHACKVMGLAGECWEGVCASTHYCALAEEGHATCASVCASYGETCLDMEDSIPGGCGDDRYNLLYVLLEDFDCNIGFWQSSSIMGGCSDPIQWDRKGLPPAEGFPPGAVSCCCTQT
jgi:hypothetical protein